MELKALKMSLNRSRQAKAEPKKESKPDAKIDSSIHSATGGRNLASLSPKERVAAGDKMLREK